MGVMSEPERRKGRNRLIVGLLFALAFAFYISTILLGR